MLKRICKRCQYYYLKNLYFQSSTNETVIFREEYSQSIYGHNKKPRKIYAPSRLFCKL